MAMYKNREVQVLSYTPVEYMAKIREQDGSVADVNIGAVVLNKDELKEFRVSNEDYMKQQSKTQEELAKGIEQQRVGTIQGAMTVDRPNRDKAPAAKQNQDEAKAAPKASGKATLDKPIVR